MQAYWTVPGRWENVVPEAGPVEMVEGRGGGATAGAIPAAAVTYARGAGERSLRVNVVWALGGNIASAASMYVLMVLLAKLATAETVGIYGVAQAVGLPISTLLSLKLQQVQVTDARRDYDFGHYFALKMIMSLIAAVIIAGVGLVSYPFETAVVTALMGIGYGIVEVREILMAVMQKAERMDRNAVSRTWLGLSALVFFGACFWVTRSLTASVLALVLSRLVVIACYDLPIARRLLAASPRHAGHSGVRPSWEWRRLAKLARLAAPLGFVAGIGTLFMSIPRLTLDRYCGTDAVGYYTAISAIITFGNMLEGAIGQTISARLARYFVENRRAFRILLLKALGLSAALGLSGVALSALAGRQLLSILYTPAYGAHYMLFVELALAGTMWFSFSTLNVGLVATRRFGAQLPVYALAALACLIASIVLVPRIGLHGAAWAMVCCHGIGLIGCAVALYWIARRPALPAAVMPLPTPDREGQPDV